MGEIGTSNNVPSWPVTMDTNSTVEVNNVTIVKAETINDVSAIALRLEKSLNGKWVDAEISVDSGYYSSIVDADAAAVAAGKTLMISTAITLPSGAITLSATLEFKRSGSIAKGSATSLTISGSIVGDPRHTLFTGFAVGDITLTQPVKPEWFATGGGTEASPYVVNFNIVDAATLGGNDGDSNRVIELTNGKHYKNNNPPFIITKARCIKGRGFIHTADANGANAIETVNGTSPLDFLLIEDVVILGGASTGSGLYIRKNTRWTLRNVRIKNHSVHGLFVEGFGWQGLIDGGDYSNNGVDGIRLESISGGQPNGVTMVGVNAEGNAGWGLNADGKGFGLKALTILGGTIETNTTGGIKANDVTNLYINTNFEQGNNTIALGQTANVQSAILENCYGIQDAYFYNVNNLEINGGQLYTATNPTITVASKGKTSIKNFQYQRNWDGIHGTGTPPHIVESSITTYNSSVIDAAGNKIGNGAFYQREDGDTSAPSGWNATDATISYDVISDLNAYAAGKVVQIDTTANAGGLSQGFTFASGIEQNILLSAWVKAVIGTAVLRIDYGPSPVDIFEVEVTSTTWKRITIYSNPPSAGTYSGSVKLRGKTSGDRVRFAQVQVVTDNDIIGWRHSSPSLGFDTLVSKFTWNPGSIAVGASESKAVTVTGAVLGQAVIVLPPYDLSGLTCTGYVSGASTVTVVLANLTAAPVDLIESTGWKVEVKS